MNTEIKSVQLEALVVMKIVQHASDTNALVTGQLLGMERDGVLEVTCSFPFPTRAEEEGEAEDSIDYQVEMMRCLREVNVDHNAVGWYQSCPSSSFINQAVIEAQFNFQQSIENSIVLVFDPLKCAPGYLPFRAFMLNRSFVNFYKANKFSLEAMQQASIYSFLDEIPISIRNSSIVNVLLYNLPFSKESLPSIASCNSGRVEKGLECLLDSLEDRQAEMSKLMSYLKSSLKPTEDDQSASHEFNRLEGFVIDAQAADACHEVCSAADALTQRHLAAEFLAK